MFKNSMSKAAILVLIYFAGVSASSSIDAKSLKDVWKGLEASTTATSPVSAPLKKTLGIYRTLLSSLEEFKASLHPSTNDVGNDEDGMFSMPQQLVDPFEMRRQQYEWRRQQGGR
jgi:hypothetical protein